MQTLVSDPDNEMGLQNRLLCEAGAMAEAALSRGKNVPPSVVTTIEAAKQLHAKDQPIPENILADLVTAHHALAELIAPALPRTMLLLQEERRHVRPWMRVLGPIRLVRYLMFVAIASLSLFILTCALDRFYIEMGVKKKEEETKKKEEMEAQKKAKESPDQNQAAKEVTKTANPAGGPAANGKQNAKKGDDGDKPRLTLFTMGWLQVIVNSVFWLSAAGIGASFVCLYKANRYVTEGTFDPRYESSYWIRFALGLISGFMLAATVNQDILEEISFLERDLIRVPLAAAGGFSAELFYTVLSRLVEACKSLLQGSADEVVKAEVTREKSRLAALQMQQQMQHAADLIKLQQSIGGSSTPEEIKKQLAELTNQILPAKSADLSRAVAATKPAPVSGAGSTQQPVTG